MRAENRQNLLAGLASAISFLLFYGVLNRSLLISIILAVGVFAGVYLITKPVQRIGDIELERIANGEEIKAIYQEAKLDITRLSDLAQEINNPLIHDKAVTLSEIAQDIIKYLEDNPKDISKSRHFLDYYIKTGLKITENYQLLKRANVSEDKFAQITERTSESLDLLQEVYANQRDGYHKDRVMELEVQTELLEKTIKLGGK